MTAGEEIGDAIFLLFARDFAPLSDRLTTIAARLEAAPAALLQVRDRLGDRTVALWLQLELEAVESPARLPGRHRGRGTDGLRVRRRRAGTPGGRGGGHEGRARATTPPGSTSSCPRPATTSRWAASTSTTLIALRAFDGLTTDEILAIGDEQLAFHKAARAAAAAEIDRTRRRRRSLARVKADHPATFDEALAEYRDAMDRARAFIVPGRHRQPARATPRSRSCPRPSTCAR